jgi:hypothetical protein
MISDLKRYGISSHKATNSEAMPKGLPNTPSRVMSPNSDSFSTLSNKGRGNALQSL